MDSFKRLFRPVANAADANATPLSKRNLFHIDNNDDKEEMAAPDIRIQRHKIPTKTFNLKMNDEPPKAHKEEMEDFGIKSGVMLSSASNYSFVSSDGLDETKRKPPVEIRNVVVDERENVFKPKAQHYKSPLAGPNHMECDSLETVSEQRVEMPICHMHNGNVLIQLEHLVSKYDGLIIDLDNRIEMMHESLLCDLISRQD